MTPRRLRGLARWIKRADPSHPVAEDGSASDVLEDLRGSGVTHFFNLVYPLKDEETVPLNEFNLRFCNETKGAIPFASMLPETAGKVAKAESALAGGALGFKFHPFVQGFDPWDERMTELYELAQERTRPVLLHTGFEAFYGKPMPAKKLIEILERFPKLPFVFVHMAFPELEMVFDAMENFPDLYLDATNTLAAFRPRFKPLFDAQTKGRDLGEIMLKGLEKYSGRIMFGTDHPVGMGSYQEIHQDLEELHISEEARRSLRHGAARAFVERFKPGFDWERRL